MSREKFEEIPQIAELLKNSVQWSEKFKIYHVKVSDNFDAICDVRYVNGAWFAWQEQQKVVDELEARMAEAEKHNAALEKWNDGLQEQIINISKALRGEP